MSADQTFKTNIETFGDDLRQHVETFISDAGISPTRFGKDALGDPGLVFDLRAGRVPHANTAKKIVDFIAAQRVLMPRRGAAA